MAIDMMNGKWNRYLTTYSPSRSLIGAMDTNTKTETGIVPAKIRPTRAKPSASHGAVQSQKQLPLCQGASSEGHACKRLATRSRNFCYAHDPEMSEQRIKDAAAATISKKQVKPMPVVDKTMPTTFETAAQVNMALRNVFAWVLDGKVDARRATAANQIGNTILRCIEASKPAQASMKLRIKFDATGKKTSSEIEIKQVQPVEEIQEVEEIVIVDE